MQTFYFIPNLHEIFNCENCCQINPGTVVLGTSLPYSRTHAGFVPPSILNSRTLWLISKAFCDHTTLINYFTSSPVFSETSAL